LALAFYRATWRPAVISAFATPMNAPRITLSGVTDGMRRGLPLLASGFVYGLAFGSLAASMGLSLLEATLMSLLVFSGTAQIAVVQIWPSQPGLLPAALIVLVANVRYVLMSASLRPWLGPVSPWRVYPLLTVMVDSAYALGLRSRAEGNEDAGVIMGSGLSSFIGWVIATALGFVSGQLFANPKAIGLDFVVIAFCLAAATAMARMVRGPRGFIPALVAGVVIVLVDRLFPGPWTVVAAGLAAAVAGAVLYNPQTDPA
jgi:4-azaleucine resistance transporter AzlC